MIEPTEQDKIEIYNKFNSNTYDEAYNEFVKLRKIVDDGDFYLLSKMSRLGNKSVNYFTQFERFNTCGKHGKHRFNFFYFVMNKNIYLEKPSFKKIFEDKKYSNIEELKILQQLFALYCKQPMIFRPHIAIDIFLTFECRKILDFTMGWGGRLIGACCCNVEKYTGIDMNINLIEPYNKMCDMIKNAGCKTEIQLFFQDCLTIDYSQLDYDMVLTSPPYYDVEIYNNCNTYSSETDWNNNFYEPLISESYKYLQVGGYYCLNIPQNVYENVCISILGHCHTFIELVKNKRQCGKNKKTEYIYIWKKNA